jgi:hypothetical protein
MFIPEKAEIRHLYEIKKAIDAGMDTHRLTELCNSIMPFLKDKLFVYTYAGSLLASKDKIEDAKVMFRKNPEDLFCSIMNDYLEDTGNFQPAVKVFKNSDPYDTYVQVDFYKNYQTETVNVIGAFVKDNPPPNPGDGKVTILDVGVGNGILLTKIINEIAPLYELQSIRLILVDQSEDMLQKAIINCKKEIDIETEITTICCKIQDITEEQMNMIGKFKPIWFVNAALSVHHMPWEVKIPMLKQMKTLSPHFLLTEVNWNHDIPEKDTPELIYSVAKNYAIFSKDILKLQVAEDKKKECLYNFPVAEAINIIRSDRSHRIDYHTPVEEWKKLAGKAGYQIDKTTTTTYVEGSPFTFVMEISA